MVLASAASSSPPAFPLACNLNITASTYKHAAMIFNHLCSQLCSLIAVGAMLVRFVHLQVVFDRNCVLVLQQIADLLESLKCLVRAALHNMTDDLCDVFI